MALCYWAIDLESALGPYWHYRFMPPPMTNRLTALCPTHAVVATVLAWVLVACGGASDPGVISDADPSDADLVVTVTAGGSQSVIIGDPIIHEITVTNVGGRTATGVELTDDLGLELEVILASTATGICPHAPIFTCSLPELAPQATTTVQITTVGRTTGVLAQHVTVSSAAVEADPSTNQLELVATVTPHPDRVPHVVAIPSSAVIAPGDTVALSAAYYAADSVPEPDRTATWTSSAESVATVDPTGVVTGIALGTAEVVSRINGVDSQPVSVTVAEAAQPRSIETMEETVWAGGLNGGSTTIVRPVRTWLPGVGFDLEIDQTRNAAYISMPTRRSIAVLDLATFSQREIAVGGTPYGLALSEDGASLFVTIHEGLIGVLNLDDFTVRYLTLGLDSSGPAEPFDVAAASGHLYVSSRSESGSRPIRIITPDGGAASVAWPVVASASTLLASPNGQRLYVVEAMSRLVSAFDLAVPDSPRFVSLSSFIQGIDHRQVALDDHAIYLGSGEIRRRDVLDLLGTLSPGIPSVNSDGTHVLVGAHGGFFSTEGQIIQHDAVTFERIASQPVACAPERMMPAVDNEHFVVLGFDAVCLWHYLPVYTIDWPGDLGVEPTLHPPPPDTIVPVLP